MWVVVGAGGGADGRVWPGKKCWKQDSVLLVVDEVKEKKRREKKREKTRKEKIRKKTELELAKS